MSLRHRHLQYVGPSVFSTRWAHSIPTRARALAFTPSLPHETPSYSLTLSRCTLTWVSGTIWCVANSRDPTTAPQCAVTTARSSLHTSLGTSSRNTTWIFPFSLTHSLFVSLHSLSLLLALSQVSLAEWIIKKRLALPGCGFILKLRMINCIFGGEVCCLGAAEEGRVEERPLDLLEERHVHPYLHEKEMHL
jgi:hypothetical protein